MTSEILLLWQRLIKSLEKSLWNTEKLSKTDTIKHHFRSKELYSSFLHPLAFCVNLLVWNSVSLHAYNPVFLSVLYFYHKYVRIPHVILMIQFMLMSYEWLFQLAVGSNFSRIFDGRCETIKLKNTSCRKIRLRNKRIFHFSCFTDKNYWNPFYN